LACRRPHRNRQRGCQHQTELEFPGPGSKHDSPQNVERKSPKQLRFTANSE
jgi:hypothetical protein